ncbi:hypothetical protein LTR85_002283 [Meristemomyces frigidus]|nr:hypothetical protein LTR85_002283 [Meristemomyces frigidus]
MSKGQYERQLQQWKYRKIAKGDEWESLHRKVEARKKRGKRTAVYKQGLLVPADKLSKEKRHDFSGPMESYKIAPTPTTPPGFVVCTPFASDLSSIFMNNLPFFQSQGHLRSLGRVVYNAEVSSQTQLTKARASVVLPWFSETEPDNTIYDTLLHLEFGAPHYSETNNSRVQILSNLQLQGNCELLESMIYLAYYNMLSELDAQNLVRQIYRSKDYSPLEALLSGRLPTMKALASTFFLAAIETSDVRLAKICLSTGMDPDTSIGQRKRPLSVATKHGSLELVQLLLQNGADVNAPPAEKYWRTALQAASEKGHFELVHLLLQNGADVNAPPTRDTGRTALQAAPGQGNIELVRLLFSFGARVDHLPSPCNKRNQQCDAKVTQSEFRRLVAEKEKLRRSIDEALVSQEKALEELRTARAREERLRQQTDWADQRASEAIAVEDRCIQEQEIDELLVLGGQSEGLALNLSPGTRGAMEGSPDGYCEEPLPELGEPSRVGGLSGETSGGRKCLAGPC